MFDRYVLDLEPLYMCVHTPRTSLVLCLAQKMVHRPSKEVCQVSYILLNICVYICYVRLFSIYIYACRVNIIYVYAHP